MADRNRGIRIVGAGIVAGIMGGIAMAALTMMYTAGIGVGFWTPLRLMAATTSGVDALIGGGGTLFWGLMIHMMASIGFGIILAAVLPRRAGAGAGFGIGLLYGVVVWAVMTFIGLPIVNTTMQARVALMPGWWFFAHLVFGGVAGISAAVMVQGSRAERESADIRAVPESSNRHAA